MLRTIEVSGVRFRVADEGTGPVLLLVHGFPLDHTMWSAQIEEFSKSYRVIAPDLRGFGGSDGGLYSTSMERYADDMAELLEALAADRPITFCGLSMGGYIAWQFAERYSYWLGRLILCDTRSIADSPEAASNRLRMANIVMEKGPEPIAVTMMPNLFSVTNERNQPIVDRVRKMVMENNPQAIAAALRGMAVRPDVSSRLPGLNVPSLVIVGERDVISPPAEMKAIADALPQSRFVQIPDAGHMAPMENPTEVNRAIHDFLNAS
jgi:3-oxoadipate enol-lactonase